MRDKDFKDDILNNEILPESFIEKIADIIDDELNIEIAECEKADADIPKEHDKILLEMAREYDAKMRRTVHRRKGKRALRIAAVIAVVIMGLGSIGISASEAFRMRVFSLFENKEDGAVVFRNDTEYELLSGWSDYWYPEYLPDGYYLLTAEESNNMGKFMLFKSVNNDEIRMYESTSDNAFSVDSDTNVYEKIYINSEEAYIFQDIEDNIG
ncbi:MAG: DUF4367 domain-containing protein, partial [Firmicutes bacterium]|nr:DUF4367 domain-containing protein [Bacillota bacterium]